MRFLFIKQTRRHYKAKKKKLALGHFLMSKPQSCPQTPRMFKSGSDASREFIHLFISGLASRKRSRTRLSTARKILFLDTTYRKRTIESSSCICNRSSRHIITFTIAEMFRPVSPQTLSFIVYYTKRA